MRVNLESRTIQRWAFVGLTPWQRSMVRQEHLRISSADRPLRTAPDQVDRALRSARPHRNASALNPTSTPKSAVSLRLPTRSGWPDTVEWFVLEEPESVAAKGSQSDQKTPVEIDAVLLARDACSRCDAIFASSSHFMLARDSIRLLWDWTPAGKIAYPWAKERGLDGVVRDHGTLRSWIVQISLLGMRRSGETHPFLSQIQLPYFSTNLPPSTDSP